MKKVFLLSACAVILLPSAAMAHGKAGNRTFPATMSVEDPGVADELTFPLVARVNETEDGVSAWGTEVEAEFSRRLTENLAVSIEGGYVDQSDNAGGASGLDNIELAAKYQFFTDPAREVVMSAGLGWDIGDSGSDDIGEDYSTVSPQFFFGKGFGTLSERYEMWRPLAVTGAVAYGIPMDRHTAGETNPDTLDYGFTVQYSLPYMQQHVKGAQVPAMLSNVTPLVEFNFSTPIRHADNHGTTGTVNPGFIWSAGGMQVGFEAIVPVNDRSGDGVGAMGQLHFYLDDLLPDVFGKPLASHLHD